MLAPLRETAKALKRDIGALWIAARDERVPPLAKIVAACTAAYALSPIDLIPDFVPLVGYLDDLLIVPLGLWAAIRLIPANLMSEFRMRAMQRAPAPRSRIAAAVIVLLWLAAAVFVAWKFGAAFG